MTTPLPPTTASRPAGTPPNGTRHHPWRREAGVVLALPSLSDVDGTPAAAGCGDLGAAAHAFVRWLQQAGIGVWQLLPLQPVGPGHSPYQSPSAFAGSPAAVALEPLVQAGWLDGLPPAPAGAAPVAVAAATAAGTVGTAPGTVDYGRVLPWRDAALRRAADGFAVRASPADRAALADWCATQSHWLPDWTLYAALKQAHGGLPWWQWDAALARREPAALAAAARQLQADREAHAFVQWCFARQWQALREQAATAGVRLMGDVPLFVAHDSADVWALPALFDLDAQHQPRVVAGCPPDGYSPDGQRWGNPMYRWDRMAEDGYRWWTARLAQALALHDLVRIDHFRGLAAAWEVPAADDHARGGRWQPGPGAALFDHLQAALPGAGAALPVVAEDLGVITPDVVELRDRFGLPGMRVVYEGFIGQDPGHPFLPHHHVPHGLVYTSTHDSDTAAGWWDGATAAQRRFAAAYCGVPADAAGADFAQALLRATATSVAMLALAPVQDLLGLGGAHRLNRPGTADGNWAWRVPAGALTPARAEDLRALWSASGRCAAPSPAG